MGAGSTSACVVLLVLCCFGLTTSEVGPEEEMKGTIADMGGDWADTADAAADAMVDVAGDAAGLYFFLNSMQRSEVARPSAALCSFLAAAFVFLDLTP